jgi:hypothetical protein
MRGRVLQYNGNDGSGVIVADGQQYAFNISLWKGNNAPAVGKTVEVVMANGLIQSTIPVADDVLLKEKAAELKDRFGGLVGGLGASVGKSGDGTVAAAAPALSGSGIVQHYGRNVLIAYVAFLLGTIVFNAISISFFGVSQGKPLYDLAELLSQMGGAGGVKFLLLLGYAGIAAPWFWRDRRSWLALCVPLLAVLWAVWTGFHAVSGVGGSGGDGPGFFDFFSFGFGFYLSLAAAIYLAMAGFKRFVAG